MDILASIRKVNNIGKFLLIAVLVMNLMSVSFASTAISSAISDLCNAAKLFLGGAIMLMILMAGATYAIGQVLGAETRARATVWATAMLMGAIIGALIYILTPVIVRAIMGTAMSTVTACNF